MSDPSVSPGRGRPRAPAATALDAGALARATRLARRMRDVLRGLLQALPAADRGSSALSRRLGVDRATCHRAVTAASNRTADAELLAKLPGVRGLRLLVGAFEKQRLDAALLAQADAAIDELEAFLREVGGSQARLVQRLRAAGAGTAPKDRSTGFQRERQSLFDAARAITGRSSEISLTLFAYRPLPDDPRRIESVGVTGVVGHVARPDAVPLVFHWGSRATHVGDAGPRTFTTIDETPARGRTPSAVLEDFSTSPVPLVTSSGPDGLLVQSVDPRAASKRPIDLVIATRPGGSQLHPALEEPPLQEAWSLQHFPARRLVFDVLLHRDLARACIASADVHLWRPGFEREGMHRWTTRFPIAPRLEALPPGLRAGGGDTWDRHDDLVAAVLDQLGWPASEMVGFRIAEAHPIWRTGYCVTLDFGRDSA